MNVQDLKKNQNIFVYVGVSNKLELNIQYQFSMMYYIIHAFYQHIHIVILIAGSFYNLQ